MVLVASPNKRNNNNSHHLLGMHMLLQKRHEPIYILYSM